MASVEPHHSSPDQQHQMLSREIQLFYKERQRLESLLTETADLLTEDFARVLSPELVASIRDNLALGAVRERVGQLFKGTTTTSGAAPGSSERPCVIIVGQTKSGKSTFINELLGGTFVAQASSPCTARVTRLTYSDQLYIRTVDRHGNQLGDVVHPEGGVIDDVWTRLSAADRENEQLLSSTVEAGVPSEFLKRGIDVIDSPGLNENATLDSLTMRAIDSFLPIILYVIDGRYGVTLAAEKDILSIRATGTGIELFYLVTKMDVSPDDIPEPGSGRTVEDIEKERGRRIFNKLQQMQCLNAEDTPAGCRRFFCLSSWEMRKYRRRLALSAKRGADPAAVVKSKWVARFEQVQQRLAEFASRQFRDLIVGTGSALLSLHSQAMEVVMSKANDIKASAMRRRKNLEHIRCMECRNHDQSKKIVDSHMEEFVRQAASFIKQQGPILLEDVKTIEYSSCVIGASLSSSQIEECCITEIQDFINNRIVTAYQDFLNAGAMRTCFQELEDLKARVSEYEKAVEQTPSLGVLRATLMEDYNLAPSDIYSFRLQTVMRQMSLNIRTLFRHPGVIFNRPVRDPEWKRYQAECHLKKIDTGRLVECLVSSMHQWLDKRHFKFLEKIRCSEQLVENAASLSELERQKIVRLSPKLAFIYTKGLEIVTGYQFRGYSVDRGNQLGAGAQGQVYAVKDVSGRVALAAKIVIVDQESLGNIASEVFHSSVLRHPNLIRVEGVRLTEHLGDPIDATWTIELYMELMHCDIWNLMQRQKLPLSTRVWFGLQLAKALEFLHSSELIHRDVKLQNLLVDSDLRTVKLTDFGLIKSAGLTGKSLVGTPIYLAPEMVTSSSYDTSADIYSLGIALWYLAEGSGRKHPEYVESLPNVGVILLASSMNCRPNRLPCIPDAMWDLMERCWDQDPAGRPPAREVVEALDYLEKTV